MPSVFWRNRRRSLQERRSRCKCYGEPNRGYFLAKEIADLASGLDLPQNDIVTATYFQIAEDLLRGELPDEFSESMIRARYGLTMAQLNAVLGRIAHEGWAEKKPGY